MMSFAGIHKGGRFLSEADMAEIYGHVRQLVVHLSSRLVGTSAPDEDRAPFQPKLHSADTILRVIGTHTDGRSGREGAPDKLDLPAIGIPGHRHLRMAWSTCMCCRLTCRFA